ncbi:hypothetical protein F7725_014624 [Dissostichus mawsoni]|uniref:Uncharacterized protein n=1 Tax=Dissostichus mawsoni TaxID=36200 RepID=A0A7J5YWY9_DISMA|nr:hypothetical protein F7725_014624 [Dissostichus mawsoni]
MPNIWQCSELCADGVQGLCQQRAPQTEQADDGWVSLLRLLSLEPWRVAGRALECGPLFGTSFIFFSLPAPPVWSRRSFSFPGKCEEDPNKLLQANTQDGESEKMRSKEKSWVRVEEVVGGVWVWGEDEGGFVRVHHRLDRQAEECGARRGDEDGM